MKLTLFGSRPSEITATFTPAPVNPSERAVGWDASSDTVPVRPRPSGTSWPFALSVHAPGITFAGGPLSASFADDVALARPADAGTADAGSVLPRSPRSAWMVT